MIRKGLILLIIFCLVVLTQSPAQAGLLGYFKTARFGKFSSDEYAPNFGEVKLVLDNIISEYQSKNIMGLMDNVSENYVGDKSNLEYSIRREFSKKAFLELTYYVDGAFLDVNDKYLIRIIYIKRTQDRATSKLKVQKGTSDIILRKENGKYTLWKMKPRFMGS